MTQLLRSSASEGVFLLLVHCLDQWFPDSYFHYFCFMHHSVIDGPPLFGYVLPTCTMPHPVATYLYCKKKSPIFGTTDLDDGLIFRGLLHVDEITSQHSTRTRVRQIISSPCVSRKLQKKKAKLKEWRSFFFRRIRPRKTII